MKAAKDVGPARKLIRELQLARSQLAKAETRRKSAKEQARLAKRRRKEAKAAARRARKQSRLAKRAVAEAKQVLAEVEQKFARARRRATAVSSRKKATSPATSASPKPARPIWPQPGVDAPGPAVQPTDRLGQAVEAARDAAPAETQNVVAPATPTSPAPTSNQPLPPDEAAA
jgi:hypothetical protein